MTRFGRLVRKKRIEEASVIWSVLVSYLARLRLDDALVLELSGGGRTLGRPGGYQSERSS